MKKYTILVFLICFSSLLGNFSSKESIKLILSSNVNGETDPCGWKKRPLGGLARKSAIIKENKNQGYEVLVADAGNLFFKKDKISPGVTMERSKETAKIIVESFNKIGCDAFSPSSHDFAGGFDFLKELEKDSKFPFISANIFGKYGEKIFEPYVIVEKQGKKIGFIGLTSDFLNEDIKVKDPFKILNELSNELSKKTDMIILLFNASEKDLNILKSKKYPIDLAVRSRSNLPPAISKDGGNYDIPIFSVGMRGKYLFNFDIKIGNKENDFIDLILIQTKLEKTNKFLENYINVGESIDLNIEFKDNPKILENINKNMDQKEKMENIINNKINYFSFTKIALDKNINDDITILNIIDLGKEKINTLYGPLPPEKGHEGHNH